MDPNLEGPHPAEFYVQAALARNPEVMAQERRVAALAEVIPQVTALPDPMVSNTVWPIPQHSPQTASGRMPYSLMVAQQFPWCGKLSLRGQIADLEAQIALSQLAETQLRVAEEAKRAYYEIYFHQQAIQITLDSEKLLRDYFLRFAEIHYTAGKVSQQDVLRAQVELIRLRDQLILLRQRLKQSQADLARVLSTSPESDLKAADEVALPAVPEQTDRLYAAAVALRPELQGRLQAVFRDQRAIELARLQYYPDVTVGIGWDLMTTADAISPVADGKDNIGLVVGFNLPIWEGKLGAGVREAQQRTAESARLYDAARNDTFRDIKRLTVQAHALEQQVTLFREELIPTADRTLRVSSKDYGSGLGKVTALEVIDNWTELLRFQIQRVRLEAALGQTLAALERAVGSQLASPSEGKAPMPTPMEKP